MRTEPDGEAVSVPYASHSTTQMLQFLAVNATFDIRCVDCDFMALCYSPSGSATLALCPECGGRAEYRKATQTNRIATPTAVTDGLKPGRFHPYDGFTVDDGMDV